jgi:ATP-binding protein involved in chromosome partitioning
VAVSTIEQNIGHVVVVGSGKGGVGKSSLVVKLAQSLRDNGSAVGILDADLTGPDIPLMLGVTRHEPASSINVWRAPGRQKAIAPIELQGLRVMSPQFMMSEHQALAVDGHLQRMLLSQLWTGVKWGELDYLLVDLPPGTGTVQQAVIDLMPVAAAVVVVTPQYVAHLDARKLVTFLGERDVRILGGVENMSEVSCPNCDDTFRLFPPVSHERTIWADGVRQLASLPFDVSAFSATSDQQQTSALDSGLVQVTAAITSAFPV